MRYINSHYITDIAYMYAILVRKCKHPIAVLTCECSDVFAGRHVVHADDVLRAVGAEHVLRTECRTQSHDVVIDRDGGDERWARVRQPGGQRNDQWQRVRVAPFHALLH